MIVWAFVLTNNVQTVTDEAVTRGLALAPGRDEQQATGSPKREIEEQEDAPKAEPQNRGDKTDNTSKA